MQSIPQYDDRRKWGFLGFFGASWGLLGDSPRVFKIDSEDFGHAATTIVCRGWRAVLPGAPRYVTERGVNRQDVLFSWKDREVYLRPACNQPGAFYDAAGNLQSVSGDWMTYDAENRQTSEIDGVTQAVETYAYDGDGRRVEKSGPAGTTAYIYDAFGLLIAEYSTAGSGMSCQTCYLSYDHLGSVRLVTDQANNVISRHDYLPFGEEIPAGIGGRSGAGWGTTDGIAQRFTGKERDAETGVDYFGARYYGSELGRFTTPDPTFLNIRKVFNPQRWNLYGYGVNNPLKFVDPDGNEAIAVYYPGYQVGVHGDYTAPLGHAGVVVVAKDGSTHYFEYGRYAPAGAGGDVAQGVVRNAGPTGAPTPDVQRDASGNITPESMKALLSTLSDASGKHGEVDAVVLNTNDSEDAAMEAYLEERERQNSDPNRQHYSISQGHNCGTLICDALGAAGRRSPTPYSFATPGGIFGEFLVWQQLYGVKQTFFYAPKKEKVTSKICYIVDGKTVCR